ncbi:integrase [Streptococcus gallinaceus]|uniref:site-specific integrase n=1 Tax=Streptococcus gallinaceus TaxID=165758 RepID=UPI0020A0BC51|nr:site-specific integrase [Streptococcus gallinaceus]MCP1639663.1 integrase [Streptococcus gallinaceus]MCP1770446.1 integrase [Streptococcus gallinaceus]
MSIKQLTKKDGTTVYRTSVFLGIDVITGKRVITTATAPTIKKLKAKEHALQNEWIMSGCTRIKGANVKNYSELVALWLDNVAPSYKYHSLQLIKAQIKNYLLPAFGAIRLDKLSKTIIQRTVNTWAVNYNTGTGRPYKKYNELHALNKRILTFGVSLNLLPTNPCVDIIIPRRKPTPAIKKHLESNELKLFLDYLETLPNTYGDFYDKVLYKFMIATGARVGECCALEWSDIDLETGTVSISKTLQQNRKVTTPKSQAGIRIISIDPKTVLLLRLYKARQSAKFKELGTPFKTVFSTGTKEYPLQHTLAHRLRKHFEAIGLSNLTFHAFRHTHASLMINAGITPKELQYRLGHSNISTTLNVYTHLSKDKEKESITYFEKAINSI